MTPEQELMAKIKTTCGPWIDAAVEGTPYPATLLAALTANESGGDPAVTRFEPAVLGQLALTVIGRKANFGALGGEDIGTYVRDEIPGDLAALVKLLVNLATSWGPMQIMGYEALADHYSFSDLPTLDKHYPHAIPMLEDFRKRFDISITGNAWGQFFDCWNTGRPHAKTFDPQYVPRGLDRMNLYGTL